MLKLRDKDLSSWLWYNKGDALPTAREITENLRRGTEYSAPADDERWISGEIIGCQNNADHIEFDLEIDGLKSLTVGVAFGGFFRSEEHTSELQSLMRNSYAVFCLKQNNEQCKNSSND